MYIKDMNRSEWTIITRKDQIICDYELKNRSGKISLFVIREISEPFVKTVRGNRIILADVNYSWLQLAMEDDFAWFTAMFDDEGQFLQLYVDLTDGNHTEADIPCFRDMYLDYVVDDQEIRILDNDELNEAFQKGIITDSEYQKAKKCGMMIQESLESRHQEIISLFTTLYQKLNTQITEKEND